MNDRTPRILPFVPADTDAMNRKLDQDIEDIDRSKELESIAEEALRDLEIDRILDDYY